MWSLRAWRRRRALARHPLDPQVWKRVRHKLAILDDISVEEDQWLQEHSVLFLLDKHLTSLDGVYLDDETRLLLAAQAQLPLLHLGDLDWYGNFHEIVLYPDDFLSPQRHRDASGVEHSWDGEHSGGADHPGPPRRAGQWRLGRLQPGHPRTGAQAGHAQWRRQWLAAAAP
jgi:Mlc titration factor MtfA (ptsG expression regulator)